ncbi:hypothetical protein [Rhodopseudomonas sp. B29]|uniref:hypothetical protein n=1 Tax=Rhodopseudomonas sp. B29 TaxID=95607 RepID=UPI00034946BC|nr:hypothetical protein [Rhodopseudomonas sp. B29]
MQNYPLRNFVLAASSWCGPRPLSFGERVAVVAAAILITILRAPQCFLAPQFYAEDGFLFRSAYNLGLASLLDPIAGTLNLYGASIALIASHAPLVAAPAIEVSGSLAAVAIVAAMATSPRFDFPTKIVAALSIACAPAAFELIGVLANAQWVLPLGLFILLFSRAAASRAILIGEAAFVLVVGLNGPVPMFLVPLFVWQTWVTTGRDRSRLLVLTALLTVAAAVQLMFLRHHVAPLFNIVEPAPYSPLLWVTMPLRWLDPLRPLVHKIIGYGPMGIAVVIVGAVALGRYALVRPYRDIKIAMLVVALIILYSGMLKYRANLQTVLDANGRYFYVGSVFFFWYLCIAADQLSRLRGAVLVLVFILFANSALVHSAKKPRAPQPWSDFVERIEGAKQMVIVPIAPPGWQIEFLPK